MSEERLNPIYVTAKYDYAASSEQELSLRKNERLRLIDDSKQWWKVENEKYQSGFVPSNYVKKEKPGLLDSLKRHVKRKVSESKITHISAPIPQAPKHLGPSSHPAGIPNKPFTAVVKFPYEPTRPDELHLDRGDFVLVVEKAQDGWWKGQTESTTGWFPSNYVQEVSYDALKTGQKSPLPERVIHRSSNESASHPSERVVLALYSYTGQSPEELSFNKGEKLIVFDDFTSDANWLQARSETTGQTGLAPRNYLYIRNSPLHELTVKHEEPLSPKNGNGTVEQFHEENVPEEMDDMIKNISSLRLSSQRKSGENPTELNGATTLEESFIDKEVLKSKPWYFGAVSRQDCDVMLSAYGTDGDFLVRDSETGNRLDYSVSLKAAPRNKHFRVYVNSAERSLTIGQRRFSSLEEMISHYERHPICTNPDGVKLTLLRPLRVATSHETVKDSEF